MGLRDSFGEVDLEKFLLSVAFGLEFLVEWRVV